MTALGMNWVRRLPSAIVGIIALFALLKMEGTSFALPIWAALVLLSAIAPIRLPETPVVIWPIRIVVLVLIIATNLSRSVEMVNMFDTRTMTWFGELCAAEMTLAFWVTPKMDAAGMRPLWLSGLVLFAASSTSDDTSMVAFAPAYFFALLIALRTGAQPKGSPGRSRFVIPWRYGIAAACALLGGAATSGLLTAHRSEITQWGMQFIGERIRLESGSLSFNTVLGSTYGQRNSLTRALRIEGDGDFSHLRGASFTTYNAGTWGPRIGFGDTDEPIGTELEPPSPSRTATVTRLLHNRGTVFAPINCAGLHFPDGTPLYRAKTRGELIRVRVAAPSKYQIALSPSEDHQGPLCTAPTSAERKLLLAVPKEIDPRVHQLASEITRGIADPRRRLLAIQRYLMSNHHYSLHVNIGVGDPVSNFLLQHKDAHCEYFASSVVILARLAGVPSRYIVGYSGHEQEADGATIVRQRDAHAWAECWLDSTGWIVLDATPGDGRPDSLTERPNWFAKMWERIQDFATSVRLGDYRRAFLLLAGAVVVIFFLAAAVRAIVRYFGTGRERDRHYAYSTVDVELAAAYRDFERLCRRLRLACPPGCTWSEYLASIAVQPEPVSATAGQIAGAKSFIGAYNRMRFGNDPQAEGIASLRSLLADIRRIDSSADRGDKGVRRLS